MSVRASVTLFGGQNDMNLAKTGNGDSCNVFGGVSKVAAHQLNGTVFYMTVAADQQLSQCNLGTPHAAGQVFAARAPVVQSTDGAAGTIDRAAAPRLAGLRAATISCHYATSTTTSCDNQRAAVSARRGGAPGPEAASGRWPRRMVIGDLSSRPATAGAGQQRHFCTELGQLLQLSKFPKGKP